MSSPTTPTVAAMKAAARAIRDERTAAGAPISHSAALEIVARRHGHRDWNTARAAAAPPAPLAPGQTVSGRYLGHPFEGRILALREVDAGARRAITIQFAAPVNVSAFESFEVRRTRIHAVVDRRGRSAEKTSNGRPHVELSV